VFFTPDFLATLRAPGRYILERGAQALGAVPFDAMPGISGALSVGGLSFDNGGATPASQVTTLPISGGTEPERHLHVRLTSGDGWTETAGLFGVPSLARYLSATVGFAAQWITGGGVTTAGRGGDLLGETFAGDYEPDGVVGGFGWTKGSGDAATWRWYSGTAGVTAACTGSAPADDRRYMNVLACAAGQTTAAYALKIDLSDPAVPVIADERLFTVPRATEMKGFELNRSPGPAASGQTAVILRFYSLSGSLVVPSIGG